MTEPSCTKEDVRRRFKEFSPSDNGELTAQQKEDLEYLFRCMELLEENERAILIDRVIRGTIDIDF